MRLPNPIKPWYVYRPSQLVRRLRRAVFPPDDPVQVVPLPWGCDIEVDIRETIGRSIWTAGLYELATAEVLWRLADRAALAADVGANIGAFTGLLAGRVAEVWAFEPHPTLAARLRRNVGRLAGQPGFAPCIVHEVALSDRSGEAGLGVPAGFAANHGLAHLDDRGPIRVQTARLDDLLGDRVVGLLKLDVEGYEEAVLRGAVAALAEGRVHHIVFEDHVGPTSATSQLLRNHGYALYRIDWRLGGPRLAPPESPARPDEPPNYLATRDPELTETRCRPRGWHCLRG